MHRKPGSTPATLPSAASPFLIGALRGEGIGPEVVEEAIAAVELVGRLGGARFEVRFGGAIGCESLRVGDGALSNGVIRFCRDIFDKGGAVLAGAGGDRFVYAMRREFDLYYKLNPVILYPELASVRRVRVSDPACTEILIVRDNRGGLYQGEARVESSPRGSRVTQRFDYLETDVAATLDVAARLAVDRDNRLAVVVKRSGLPEMTKLWFDCAEQTAAQYKLDLGLFDIDFAVYEFLAHPERFDVIATPNCFGDILADLGGLLMGSRGVTYGASFNADGSGVFQTNHGAAYDLAGRNLANPSGQLFSAAMLLRHAFGLDREASWIERGVRAAWNAGWRTVDLAEPGGRTVGTTEFCRIVRDCIATQAQLPSPRESDPAAR